MLLVVSQKEQVLETGRVLSNRVLVSLTKDRTGWVRGSRTLPPPTPQICRLPQGGPLFPSVSSTRLGVLFLHQAPLIPKGPPVLSLQIRIFFASLTLLSRACLKSASLRGAARRPGRFRTQAPGARPWRWGGARRGAGCREGQRWRKGYAPRSPRLFGDHTPGCSCLPAPNHESSPPPRGGGIGKGGSSGVMAPSFPEEPVPMSPGGG